MTEAHQIDRLNRHYARPQLADAIWGGLKGAGIDPEHFAYDALSPLDHFHTLGKEASDKLARLANPRPGAKVLDIGGGLGGPARMLAAEYGCEVTVLDVTEAYCRIGAVLTQRAGLSDRVRFRQGDALDLPFEADSFDCVWTQHCTMNIDDKAGLYREIARVLRSGGKLASHEIMAGPVQPIHFPVPWAAEPELSFLVTPAETHHLLERVGLQVLRLDNDTATACAWYRDKLAAAPATPPPLGLHLLVGENSPRVFDNVLRNYEEGRTAVIQVIGAKR